MLHLIVLTGHVGLAIGLSVVGLLTLLTLGAAAYYAYSRSDRFKRLFLRRCRRLGTRSYRSVQHYTAFKVRSNEIVGETDKADLIIDPIINVWVDKT
jgi:hypothetical protein